MSITDIEQIERAKDGWFVGEPLADGTWPWDGRDRPYAPRAKLDLDPKVRLHRGTPVDLDPVLFEIVSAKLWNINEEHAETIQRVSGSPVVVFANDFNACIQTESGESFLFAPYIQHFTANSEFIIKYTLETRGGRPGIRPGDIFAHSDHLVAGSHQQDIGVYSPVFVGEEIFCWVFNAAHAADVGGTEPGSFCIQAPDIYHDPTPIRALKLADADGICPDIEDQILRHSRLPHVMALELRSQVAGITRARQRLGELVEHYGPDVVKAVMYKLIDDTDAAVKRRLQSLPDGRWTEVNYCSGALPGDRQIHRVVLNLEKVGDRLLFTNDGTDDQTGSINCGFGHWRSSIGAALSSILAYEHRYCTAGVLRRTSFRARLGTITAVDREGAVSALHAQLLTMAMATRLVSRMIYPSPELRQSVLAGSGVSTTGHMTHYGTDQRGNGFATVTLDEVAGSLGGFTFRDGVDQGGANFWPRSEVGDCESTEEYFPVLYLYRRSGLNGGHGRWRGGNGVSWAFVGHRSNDQRWSAISMAASLPTAAGLAGGHWGGTNWFYAAQNTDIRARFAAGQLPSRPEELHALEGDGGVLPAKANGMPLGPDDIAETVLYASGAYGDPLDREPARVAADVSSYAVRADIARDVYGVVLGTDGQADLDATQHRRDELRRQRLERASEPDVRAAIPSEPIPDAPILVEVADRLGIARLDDGELVWVCRHCATPLAAGDDNYKLGAATIDGRLTDVDPQFVDPAVEIDVEMTYRTYLCPGCAGAFEHELVAADDPPVWDTYIDVASLPRS